MNYEEMSDHDINMAVTCIVYNCHDWPVKDNNSGFYHCGVDGSCHYIVNCIDFCNSPSDSWHIILENNITLELSADSLYEAYSVVNGVRFSVQFSEKSRALRAAMICFLKMKES
jgi:hypothetical protein